MDYSRCARRALQGAAAGAAVFSALNAPAIAQSPLRDGLLGQPAENAAPVLAFADPDGRVRFVLDRSDRSVAFARFDDDGEVIALRPTAGPRGDELYRSDAGHVTVRVTPYGGVTLFRGADRMGAPVAVVGAAAPISAPPEPPRLAEALAELQKRAAALIGRTVAFETPYLEGPAAGLVLDAATRAARGLVASRNLSVKRVVILLGRNPSVMTREDGALVIVVAPQFGYAGLPSSAMVARMAAANG